MTGKAGGLSNRKTAMVIFSWTALFLAGLSVWLLSFLWAEHARVWRALLISFLYFTSLAGGLVVWLAIITAAKGRWAVKHENTAAAAITFFLPSLVALIVLWVASPYWAPWYGRLTPQGFWLNNSFLFARQVTGFVLFWGMAWIFLRKWRLGGGRGAASFCIFAFCCIFSLLGFDLVMALDFHWHSSLFGGYFFISALYIGIAAWGLMAAWQPDADLEFRRNLAGLLLAFSILTTYMMFCQLLPIWYENLAGETRFLYDRLHFSPAIQITYGLLATVYLGPLVLLLTRRARESRGALGLVSALIILCMWIERWWLVAPTFSRQPLIGITEVSIGVAFLGLLGGGMAVYADRHPALPGGES